MSMKEVIQRRRTIKSFKKDTIDRDDVMNWLEAASYAPNHRMNEPWEILFLGPETRAKLNHKTDLGGAPIVLAVLSKSASKQLERDENVMAVSCFIQNFMLLAEEAGAGVFWSSIGAQPQNRELLGAADGAEVIGVLGVGYPAEIPALKPRTPIADKVTEMP
ncbi:nitroreductase family protein [Paenibacillus brevis]|uniref:Nitroreductase family protein n=1 Tax=Paenibacillus brevis TaxID=2841508 RepID=A0ABS6FT09_9BACL|nr:nitroreductase family protein [Paenibacillus brevis]MBU5673374.1 nitroreductase family protein [Paenibacillus brevis]